MDRRPNSVQCFKSYKVEEGSKHRDHGPSHRLKDFLSFIEDSPFGEIVHGGSPSLLRGLDGIGYPHHITPLDGVGDPPFSNGVWYFPKKLKFFGKNLETKIVKTRFPQCPQCTKLD